jgi:hypothetical protein
MQAAQRHFAVDRTRPRPLATNSTPIAKTRLSPTATERARVMIARLLVRKHRLATEATSQARYTRPGAEQIDVLGDRNGGRGRRLVGGPEGQCLYQLATPLGKPAV